MTRSADTVGAEGEVAEAPFGGEGAAGRIVRALSLPPESRVDQRIPKKLFQEHGAPTAVDRRLLQAGLDEAYWVAALKPTTVGTPVYRDEVLEYLEIAVIAVRLRPSARAGRLMELMHRAVPYPVVLVAAQGQGAMLSLAHKRVSQAGGGQWVVERVEGTAVLGIGAPDALEAAFLASLPLADQPAQHLFAVYDGWMARLTALAAGRITGHFRVGGASEDAVARRGALDEYIRLTREAAALRAQAGKEKQLARRVELNLAIRRLDARLADLLGTL